MPDMDVVSAMDEHETDNRQRFNALFASYGPDIVAYCGWRAGSPSDAQDAVAEVFLTAWRRLDDVPEGDAARIWLYATARKVIANQRRSARRRLSTSLASSWRSPTSATGRTGSARRFRAFRPSR